METETCIKEEIYKCSKCGLCKSVCPVYLATKNEMFLPRGRYVVLNERLSSNEVLSSDFVKSLDICLNCNACKQFCPSSIDSVNIFTYFKNKFNFKYSLFNYSSAYMLSLFVLKFFSVLYKFFPFKSLFINSYIDKLFDVKVLRVAKKSNLNKIADIVYFEGCVNKYINPTDKNASLNLLQNEGYNVAKVISLCCGYPYFSEGNYNAFKKQAEKVIKSIPKNVKYIVCSCDTCLDTLKKYSQFIDNSDEFLSKLIRIDELVKIQNIQNSENTYYFKPLLRDDECILSSLNSFNQKGICSTFENFFAFKYPQITSDIIKNNFPQKGQIDNKTIVTTCQLSKQGLMYYLNKINSNAQVLSYSEYILKLQQNSI